MRKFIVFLAALPFILGGCRGGSSGSSAPCAPSDTETINGVAVNLYTVNATRIELCRISDGAMSDPFCEKNSNAACSNPDVY